MPLQLQPHRTVWGLPSSSVSTRLPSIFLQREGQETFWLRVVPFLSKVKDIWSGRMMIGYSQLGQGRIKAVQITASSGAVQRYASQIRILLSFVCVSV